MKSFFLPFFFLKTILLYSLAAGSPSYAADTARTLEPAKAVVPPAIDGVLTDEIWKSAPSVDTDFMSYNPLRGKTLPMKTEVWVAYDSRNLYFAFRCRDAEPDMIKTSITKRDNIFSDDWVGLSLDAFGTRQSTYDLFVNPNGIQADILDSVSNGEDTAPDWVWESAGKITPEGYQVEICIPLCNFRYRSGDTVDMGILFWRKISRLGLSGSWPEIPEGKWVFGCHAVMTLHDIETARNITVLPSVTFGSARAREHPGSWNAADRTNNLGFGATYGITSTITAEATVHPDYSQVESDTFQVEVNRRYPVFYDEKRPYFMEARSFFNIAGASDNSSLYTSVHTRKIIDPSWSVKLNGVSGNAAYGVLFAEDNKSGEGETDEKPRFAIARGKYSLKGESFIGGIYSGHESGNEFNHVVGVDGVLIPGQHHTVNFSLLEGVTRPDSSPRERTGTMAAINYQYKTQSFRSLNYFEHYTRDFSMDTAFYERTGFTRVQNITGLNFFPSGNFSWVRKVAPYIWMSALEDAYTEMRDYAGCVTIQANFSRQGYARIRRDVSREAWAGRYFYPSRNSVYGEVQTTNYISIYAYANMGKSIYYNTLAPFLGDATSYGGGFTFQPGSRFNQRIDYDFNTLKNPADGTRAYTDHIVNSRSTYQFNRYFFIRASLQYDSWRDTLLQDYLASFTLIPGTVVHFGYGSLSERQEWREEEWEKGVGDLHPVRESLFFKTSYLHRF